MTIAVCIIATNNYKEFLPKLTRQVEKFFLLNHHVNVHIFSNYIFHSQDTDRVKFFCHPIPGYKFPQATLYRYKIMTEAIFTEDYIFYIDSDMGIIYEIGDEILGDLVAVRHPGYMNGGWGSKKVDKRSNAYLPEERWITYYAGGFQGGKNSIYYFAMKRMAEAIEEDERNNIMAQWHDESHWNKYLAYSPPEISLGCAYCMPEAEWKREKWGIGHIEPKILALEKDTRKIRS